MDGSKNGWKNNWKSEGGAALSTQERLEMIQKSSKCEGI